MQHCSIETFKFQIQRQKSKRKKSQEIKYRALWIWRISAANWASVASEEEAKVRLNVVQAKWAQSKERWTLVSLISFFACGSSV